MSLDIRLILYKEQILNGIHRPEGENRHYIRRMKEKLTDELKEIFVQGKNWMKLEVEYAKLTLAEKMTMLFSAMIIGAVCLLMGMVVLILLAFALVELFRLMMSPALAYLSSAGVIVVLIVLFYLFRKPLLLNPIARFITRLFISK